MHLRSPNRRTVLQGFAGAAIAAVASQASAAARPLSFLAVGDWGRGGERHQTAVAQAMGEAAAETGSNFVLSVGDNFYPDGVQSTADPHWKASFEDVYAAPSLQVPWYAALGNHDYRGKPAAQIAYSATSSRWRMPGRNYVVSGEKLGHPALELFVLDTTPLLGEDGETLVRLARGRVSMPDPQEQLEWFEASLAASRADWKIVVGHHPIRSGGHHGGSSALLRQVEPLLEAHGVQAYLCGHDHSLQHIHVGGPHHICTGAGSSAGHVEAVEGTIFAAPKPGFAILTLVGGGLQLAFRGADGATLYQADIARGRTVA